MLGSAALSDNIISPSSFSPVAGVLNVHASAPPHVLSLRVTRLWAGGFKVLQTEISAGFSSLPLFPELKSSLLFSSPFLPFPFVFLNWSPVLAGLMDFRAMGVRLNEVSCLFTAGTNESLPFSISPSPLGEDKKTCPVLLSLFFP